MIQPNEQSNIKFYPAQNNYNNSIFKLKPSQEVPNPDLLSDKS